MYIYIVYVYIYIYINNIYIIENTCNEMRISFFIFLWMTLLEFFWRISTGILETYGKSWGYNCSKIWVYENHKNLMQRGCLKSEIQEIHLHFFLKIKSRSMPSWPISIHFPQWFAESQVPHPKTSSSNRSAQGTARLSAPCLGGSPAALFNSMPCSLLGSQMQSS